MQVFKQFLSIWPQLEKRVVAVLPVEFVSSPTLVQKKCSRKTPKKNARLTPWTFCSLWSWRLRSTTSWTTSPWHLWFAPHAVLQLVKRLVRVAARRVGHMRVRSHRASLVHNSPKARRRSVALLEECLVFASMARGGVYFTLETAKYRLWSPRGDWVPPEHRADVLMASPMVAFMDLYTPHLGPRRVDVASLAPATDGCKSAFGS